MTVNEDGSGTDVPLHVSAREKNHAPAPDLLPDTGGSPERTTPYGIPLPALTAFCALAAVTLALPLGSWLAHTRLTGSPGGWNFLSAYSPGTFFLAVIIPAVAGFGAYMLTRLSAGKNPEEPEIPGRQVFPAGPASFTAPPATGPGRRDSTVSSTPDGLDSALNKLASIEAMIRQHIEAAGMAGSTGKNAAGTYVSGERGRLIGLTENLNVQADRFAAAIARTADTGLDTAGDPDRFAERLEQEYGEQISRLEEAATRAMASFRSLQNALLAASRTPQDTSLPAARENSPVTASGRATPSGTGSLHIRNTQKPEPEKILPSGTDRVADGPPASVRKQAEQDGTRAPAEEKCKTDRNRKGYLKQPSPQQTLEYENERLAALIEEQQRRADRLAGKIAVRKKGQHEKPLQKTENLQRISTDTGRTGRIDGGIRLVAATPDTDPQSGHGNVSGIADRQKPAHTDDSRDTAVYTGAHVLDAGMNGLHYHPPDISVFDPARHETGNVQEGSPPESTGKNSGSGTAYQDAVSWKAILAAADRPDGESAAAGKTPSGTVPAGVPGQRPDTVEILSGLQKFTCDLETRLFGTPPPVIRDRFENGNRNIYTERLLALDEEELKKCIGEAAVRDRTFKNAVREFLVGFELLLETATAPDSADQELEEYLGLPLGRMYLLLGGATGYFE